MFVIPSVRSNIPALTHFQDRTKKMNAVDATLLLKPIGDVEWPASLKTRTRIRNLFRNKGVRTVGDLSKTREELMRAPNLGNVSVTAIETALAGMNLQLERQ